MKRRKSPRRINNGIRARNSSTSSSMASTLQWLQRCSTIQTLRSSGIASTMRPANSAGARLERAPSTKKRSQNEEEIVRIGSAIVHAYARSHKLVYRRNAELIADLSGKAIVNFAMARHRSFAPLAGFEKIEWQAPSRERVHPCRRRWSRSSCRFTSKQSLHEPIAAPTR